MCHSLYVITDPAKRARAENVAAAELAHQVVGESARPKTSPPMKGV